MVCRGSPELTFMSRQGTSTVVSLSIVSRSLSLFPFLYPPPHSFSLFFSLSTVVSLTRAFTHGCDFQRPFRCLLLSSLTLCFRLYLWLYLPHRPPSRLHSRHALFRLSRSVARFFSRPGSSLEVKEKRVRLGKAPLCRRSFLSMLLSRMC